VGDCHCSNGSLVLIFLVSYKETMFLMFRTNLKNFGVSSFYHGTTVGARSPKSVSFGVCWAESYEGAS
jgi:hypothetical protein